MTDFPAARQAMVDGQVRPADVTQYPVIDALLHVAREAFVPNEARAIAYVGDHVPMGGGRALLETRVLAKMLDALALQREDHVLDLGALQGYSSAVIARIAGSVVALEEDESLAMLAEARLSGDAVSNASVATGPLVKGAARQGPYDAMVVEGGITTFPDALARQLKPGGRVAAIFSEGASGQARLGILGASGMVWRRLFDATAPVLPGFGTKDGFRF